MKQLGNICLRCKICKMMAITHLGLTDSIHACEDDRE